MHKGFKWTALATALVLALGSMAAAGAAEGGVPEALNRVNSTLNALIATSNRLATSVDRLVAAGTPLADPTVLVTSTVRIGTTRTASCLVTNTGTTPIGVKIHFVDGLTGSINPNMPFTSVGPNLSQGTQFAFVAPAFRYCRFEAANATSALRASLVVYEGTGEPVAVSEAR